MSSKDTATFPRLNGLNGPGRPTKRTKKVIAELTDAISAGAPFGLACQAAGIHYDTFCDWRRRDPAFALQIDQAAARGTVKRLKKIEAQGNDGAWAALAWMVERRYPADFAKPEVALNVGIQNNLGAGVNGHHSFETVVVNDLEFLKLRDHENYQHHRRERPNCDVEAEPVVPPELSGSLTIQGYPGCSVVSESQAREMRRREEEASAKIDALLAAKGNERNANSPNGTSDG